MKATCLAVFICVFTSHGSTLRVPAEYPTIQSALNASDQGDTVLVDLGVYAESVLMPTHSVVLKGNVEPDTGLYARPIIDPSTLSNPQFRRCFTTSGNYGYTIEDIQFRNGPAMYPHTGIGGIHHLDSLGVFRRCVWDSTYVGISADAPLRLEDCVFIDNIWQCVDARNVAVRATNTSFHGRTGGWAVIECGSETELRNCRMTTQGQGRNFLADGDFITITNCDFGPFERSSAPIVEIRGRMNLIDSCQFHDCDIGGSIVYIESPCDAQTTISFCTFVNNFRHSQWSPPTHQMLNANSTEDSDWCFGVEVRDNIFRDALQGHGAWAMTLSGKVSVTHNRIYRTGGSDLPTVYASDPGPVLRENIIYQNLKGVGTDLGEYLDARFNWWGDASGPYHPTLNPLGQGDEVSDGVDFDPWYTDTLFFTASPEPRPPLPESASLLAYPNPFNSVATFKLNVPRAMIARIELFDVTGRRVKELWSGAVSETKTVTWQADDFASGLYFVRAWDPLGNRPLALAKVVLLK